MEPKRPHSRRPLRLRGRSGATTATHRHKAARALSACTTALLLVLLPACASTPPPADLPSLTDIASEADERADQIIPPPENPAQGIASFQAIDLPLNQPLDDAWAIVDETAFPALTRGVWNANGLRIGLLPRSEVNDFIQALPPAQGINRSQLIGSAHPTPILRTPRLTGYATIDLTIPPRAVREVDITGGRLQLLARLTRDQRGVLVLDLLPHHHVPKLTLEPRSPLEKQLDGRIFNELGLRVEIPATHMLVVGLYRPWPTPEEAPPAEPGQPANPTNPAPPPHVAQDDTSPPAANAQLRADPTGRILTAEELAEQADESNPPAAAVDPPPLRNHLGRAFFASQRLGRPLQTLMLITVEPLQGHPPTYAPAP